MKVVNMGNIADAFKFDDLPATGIVIEATPKELKLLPNLAYKDVTISEHVSNAAAMREVAELRECLKEAMVDAVAEYKNNSCFRNVKCGEIERCGTCKVMKWRKALEGASND